jgi:hypothetical protein
MDPNQSRRDLLDEWRTRVQAAERAYKEAATEAAAALEDFTSTSGAEDIQAFQESQDRASAALDEYMRVLKIFHELTVPGKLPPDPLVG